MISSASFSAATLPMPTVSPAASTLALRIAVSSTVMVTTTSPPKPGALAV